jgi:hypothetical protein
MFYINKEKEALKTCDKVEVGQVQPVDEVHLNNNEYIQAQEEKKAIFRPRLDTEGEKFDSDSYEDVDEDYDWYKPSKHQNDTYFCMINQERRTLKKGEQAWNCYGNRSNRFLLLNYGFCFANNRYDSYSFKVKMDLDLNDLFVPFMPDWTEQHYS